jgi:hypothetical protein
MKHGRSESEIQPVGHINCFFEGHSLGTESINDKSPTSLIALMLPTLLRGWMERLGIDRVSG